MFEKFHSIIYTHVQDIADGFATLADFQGFPVVSPPLTGFAGNLHIRQEIHLYHFHACSLAGFASATLDIKGESAWLVTPDLGFRQLHKQAPYIRKHTSIGGRIRTWGTTDRALVDFNNFVNMFQTR